MSELPDESGSVLRSWTRNWLGVLGLAFVNGGLHRAYEPALGTLRAEQLSNATLLAVVVPWALWTNRRHPTRTVTEALTAGAMWSTLTVTFEFLGGHYINGDSWQTLLEAYDVPEGHLWPLTVAGVGLAPAAAHWWHRRARE